jgi:Family of unknown function (DUF6174)
MRQATGAFQKAWTGGILFLLAMTASALADSRKDFDAARKSWQSANFRSYSFTVKWQGDVLIAPYCADAQIRVRVRDGVQVSAVVVRGSRAYPRGTRGKRIAELDVPLTIEDAFERVLQHIENPVTPEDVTVAYDVRLPFVILRRKVADL